MLDSPLPSSVPASEGSSKVILLVDDDEPVRGMLAMGIASLGHRVLTAGSAEEALETARQNPDLNLAVIDIRMPGMSGVELAGKLRELHPALRTLFCTGSTLDSLAQQGVDLDAGDYLLKPVTLAVLREKLGCVRD